jgi:hypothetical protein
MAKLTEEQRAQLKIAHPDAILFRTPVLPGHDFVFRQATVAEFDAFLGAINGQDSTAKVYAHRTLARDLLLYPSEAEWNTLTVQKPGVAHTLGHELSVRTGLNAEVLVDAL